MVGSWFSSLPTAFQSNSCLNTHLFNACHSAIEGKALLYTTFLSLPLLLLVLLFCDKCNKLSEHLVFKKKSRVKKDLVFVYVRCKGLRRGKVCNKVSAYED